MTHLHDLSPTKLEQAEDLIWRMIELNPLARISAADALTHDFFNI